MLEETHTHSVSKNEKKLCLLLGGSVGGKQLNPGFATSEKSSSTHPDGHTVPGELQAA